MAWLKFTAKIPNGYTEQQKRRIGEDIVNLIILRTKSGLDKNGNQFANYSKAYAEKKGVGRSDVDLIVTGSMLEGLKVLKVGKDYIDIGYDGRTKQAQKAEGNILGSYGRNPDADKARDFLGAREDEIKGIVDLYKIEDIREAEYLDNVDRIYRDMGQARINELYIQMGLDKELKNG